MRRFIFLAAALAWSFAVNASVEVAPQQMVIGGDVVGGTAGAILFIGAGPVMTQDSAGLSYDSSAKRVSTNGLTVARAAVSTTTNAITVTQAGTSSGGRGIQITQSGTAGAGINSAITNASNGAAAVIASTIGDGQAIYGEAAGTGTGVGVAAVKTSSSGNALAIASGSTGSYVAQNVQQTPSFTSYGITWPAAQGASNTSLVNDGSGVLSWVALPSAPSIGGALAGSTTGRVLFGGAGSTFDDDDGLFYDDTNNRLGMGSLTPGTKIEISGTSDTSPLLFGGNGSAIRFNDTGQITGAGQTLDFVPDKTKGNTGMRLIPYSALGTNDTFVQLFADSSAYGYIEAYGGLGLAVGTGTVTPTLFTVNRVEKMRLDTSGNLGIGTDTPTAKLDVNSDTMRLRTAKTPASATEACAQGTIAWDASYVYVCVATDTWKRTAIATW